MMLLPLLLSFFAAEPTVGPGSIVLRAAKVFTAAEAGTINDGVVIVRDGKVLWVGSASTFRTTAGDDLGAFVEQKGAEWRDLGEHWLVPGLHEPHCHIAGGMGDLNDMVYLSNPDLSNLSCVEPNNEYVLDARAGGVTTALFIPGSGTNMGGFGTLVKMAGDTVDEMVVRSPGSLKVAQAGNPERYLQGVGRAWMNWNTRDTLQRGKDWAAAYAQGEVPFDPYWEDMPDLVSGRTPISVHTQVFQVVMNTITMLKRDLELNPFIDHGTFDGFLNGPLAVEYGVAVMNGPRQFWFDRSRSRIMGNGDGWEQAEGIELGYNTDAPVVPQEELPFQAAMALRLGVDDPADALVGITSRAADTLGVGEISGRIAVGLDADLVEWTGFPLDPRSWVVRCWVRGELVYDTEHEARRF